MIFLKRLFGRSSKPDQTMHGIGPIQTTAEHDLVRARMEAEVLGGKARRAAKVAADAAKEASN
jgi:hypothetical protein